MNNEPIYASIKQEIIEDFEAYCSENDIPFTIDNNEQADPTYKCDMSLEQMKTLAKQFGESAFLYHMTSGISGKAYETGGSTTSSGQGYNEMLVKIEELQKKVDNFEPQFNSFKETYEERMGVFEEHLRKLLGIETLFAKEDVSDE